MNRILIIDDDYILTVNLTEILKYQFDFEVKSTHSVDDGFNLLLTEKFDALVLDLMMPTPESWSDKEKLDADDGRLTGGVLFQKIREIQPSLPIMIYSTAPTNFHGEKCVILQKPEFAATIGLQLKILIGSK